MSITPSEWPEIPGNYIFAKETDNPHCWIWLYVGETGDLWDRLRNHEKRKCVLDKYEGTHIHVREHDEDDKDVRQDEECDLLQVSIDKNGSKPPCHDQ